VRWLWRANNGSRKTAESRDSGPVEKRKEERVILSTEPCPPHESEKKKVRRKVGMKVFERKGGGGKSVADLLCPGEKNDAINSGTGKRRKQENTGEENGSKK